MLVVTRMWPHPKRPYRGIFVHNEVAALRRLGIDCHVIAEPESGGVHRYIRLWRRMREALKTSHFDVVHAHYGTTGVIGRLQMSAPLVVTFHGSDLMGGRLTQRGTESFGGRIQMALSWLVARLARDIIVVSPSMLRKTSSTRANVIPAGVDLELFRPRDKMAARRALGISIDHQIVLFAADPANINKRYDLALAAVAISQEAIPGVELKVVKGRPPEEMPLWLSAADALLLTSKSEGSPMVIKEALACNLPIVSVDVGDVADRLRDVRACRVVSPEPDALAAALITVRSEAAYCNGREFVGSFASDIAAAKVAAVYRSAYEGKRADHSNHLRD